MIEAGGGGAAAGMSAFEGALEARRAAGELENFTAPEGGRVWLEAHRAEVNSRRL